MSTPASDQVEAVLYRVVVGVVITAIKLRFISIESQPKKNTSLAAPGALAQRLQRRTACNT